MNYKTRGVIFTLAIFSLAALIAHFVSATTESTTFTYGTFDTNQGNFKGLEYCVGGKDVIISKITKDSQSTDVGLLQVRHFTSGGANADSEPPLANFTMDATNDWGTGTYQLSALTCYWIGLKPNATGNLAFQNGVTYNVSGTVFGNWSGATDGSTRSTNNAFVVKSIDVNPLSVIGVNLTNPLNRSNFSSTVGQTFNSTASIGSGTAVNATRFLYDNTGALISTNFTNVINAGNKSNFSMPTLTDGLYSWAVQMCGNDGICLSSPNFTFTVDTVVPIPAFTYPPAYIKYQRANANLSINWTLNELNPSVCLLNYGNVNYTTNCIGNTTSVNVTTINNRNATLYVNDSVGNSNSTFTGWNYYIFENSRSFSATTTEIATETYSVNITYNTTLFSTISTVFVYNNTNYTALVSGSGSTLTFSTTLAVPTTPSAIARNLYWIFNVQNTTGSEQILTDTSSQTVNKFSIDNCSTNQLVILNYSLKDEDNQFLLNPPTYNATFDVNTVITSLANMSLAVNVSYQKNSTSNTAICVPVGSLSASSYRLDSVIGYTANGYAYEFHNIQNYSLNLTTANQNITLYDLISSRSQAFSIYIKDDAGNPIQGAVIDITRKYISEGVFKSVEVPVSDVDGKVVGHLVPDTVIYTFVISKDGRVLYVFNNVYASCQTPSITTCVLNLNQLTGGVAPPNFLIDNNLAFAMTWNGTTRTVTSIFSTRNGANANFTFNVLSAIDESTIICSQSVITSSGSLPCTIPLSYGNNTVITKFYKDGTLFSSSILDVRARAFDLFGNMGVFMAIVMFLTLPLMALSSGAPIALVFAAVGFILAGSMNFIDNFSLFGIGSASLYVIMAILVIIWKYQSGER